MVVEIPMRWEAPDFASFLHYLCTDGSITNMARRRVP